MTPLTHAPAQWPDAAALAFMACHNLRLDQLAYPPPVLARIVYSGWPHQPYLFVGPDDPIPEVNQTVPRVQGSLQLRVFRRVFEENERTWYLHCEQA